MSQVVRIANAPDEEVQTNSFPLSNGKRNHCEYTAKCNSAKYIGLSKHHADLGESGVNYSAGKGEYPFPISYFRPSPDVRLLVPNPQRHTVWHYSSGRGRDAVQTTAVEHRRRRWLRRIIYVPQACLDAVTASRAVPVRSHKVLAYLSHQRNSSLFRKVRKI